jgi:hypothetical protein
LTGPASELDRLLAPGAIDTPLDLVQLDQILKTVEQPKASLSYWQQIFDWLKQYYPEAEAMDSEWLAPLVNWFFKYGDLFFYFG